MDLSAFISERLASGRKLMAPYLCAGFPEPSATLPLLLALADAGADLIELGVPFSDPLADGPVLQAASLKALRGGMNLEKAMELAAEFHRRRPKVPLLLMGYANPVLVMGRERFAQKARAAGISALLIPDLPPECAGLIQVPGLPPLVPFAAPNTSDARLRSLGDAGGPFLYAISVLGVTGTRDSLDPAVPAFLARAKARSGLPVLAGFGVSRPEQVPILAPVCDGLILGSALAEALRRADPARLPEAARAFLAPFRAALDVVEASCC
jgi:tryptophan synthase alpha subunit